MYKLTSANDPKLFAYGMVYFTGKPSCGLELHDDVFVYDTLRTSTINLACYK
jgi:hypothetical protein